MGELHNAPRHPLSGADPEFYFNLHMVALDINQKESMTHGQERFVCLGWQLT